VRTGTPVLSQDYTGHGRRGTSDEIRATSDEIRVLKSSPDPADIPAGTVEDPIIIAAWGESPI